jgi:hypothetical protein
MQKSFEHGEIKGFLASQFYAEPFAFHFLKFTEVSPEAFNQGKGSKMVAEFTESLRKNKSCGILFNSIQGPARDIYEKSGWVELNSHPGWFAFNLPTNLEQTKLDEAIITLQII